MERKKWVDVAKGYGIILVVVQHVIGGEIGKYILMFHMPLFFWLSGFCFNIDKYKTNKDFIKHIVRRIQTYFLIAIPLIIYTHISTSGDASFLLLIKTVLVQKRTWTIWFFACLIIVEILVYLIEKTELNLNKKDFIVFLFLVLGLAYSKLVHIPLIWNVDVAFVAVFPFWLGRRYRDHKQKWNSKYLCILSWIMLVFLKNLNEYMGGNSLDMGDQITV